MSTLREEYEAWFCRTYGRKPMPIDGIVHDFCWEGYRVGAASKDTPASAMWYNSIERANHDRDFYCKLLDECGYHAGPEVFTDEEGTIMDKPLRYKIPQAIANMAQKQKVLEAAIDKLQATIDKLTAKCLGV